MEEVIVAALLGLATTSSAMIGVALGLYVPISKRLLGCILAFASGGLISALAIQLAFNGAVKLHHLGSSVGAAWLLVGSGFAIGAIIYSVFSRYLEQKGAAVRYPTRFREFVEKRREHDAKELIELLSRCDLLRHLPPQEIETILPYVRTRRLGPGQVLFNAGDPGDALYIVASGQIEILEANGYDELPPDQHIASLGAGEAFGEMALLSGSPRTATARSAGDVKLLEIGRTDFERLVAGDRVLARAVERLSHDRALDNLSAGTPGAASWAAVASSSLERLTRREADKILAEGGHGAGIPIVLGNVLDTIPGCLVIGSTFHGFGTLSLTLMLGMFIGGIPEAAASAATMRRAGFRPPTIFGLWSTILVAGTLAAAVGNGLIGGSFPLLTVFAEAVAGGAVLALVTHAMIPEAIEEAGSLIVLPTTAGFLAALYLALTEYSA
jgi:CRP-like cAMP-binding protein